MEPGIRTCGRSEVPGGNQIFGREKIHLVQPYIFGIRKRTLERAIQRIDVNFLPVHLFQIKFAILPVYVYRRNIFVFSRTISHPVDTGKGFSLPAEQTDIFTLVTYRHDIFIGHYRGNTIEQKVIGSFQRNIFHIGNVLQNNLFFRVTFCHVDNG